MSQPKSLLIELGTEELPPGALDELAAAFLRGICQGLSSRGIDAGLSSARAYASPRRLAVYVPAVAAAQPAQTIERRGPAVRAALDAEGRPGPALLGFARSCGVAVEQLEKLTTDKGAWFVYRSVQPGQPVAALLPAIVDEALKGLPIPRPMRWADHDFSFVRPVHWLVMLHGDALVEGKVLGLASGRLSRGHRFMHPGPVPIAEADGWLDALRAARVLADPAERRTRIRDEVARAAAQTGGVPQLDDALLDEIANLTEWPVAIACAFEREYLAVPPEVLITTMETNQKFVPVLDAQGRLTEHFIGVANVHSADPAQIRKGYERVIRPRFADAKFFWDEDLKTPLAGYQEALKQVTYQQALGSLWDKSLRVAELSRIIAGRIGVDAAAATRAAALAKCDLVTRMVGEFPELQGIMGRYYAQHHGESPDVAAAIDEHYRPRFAGDAIAAGALGRVLAVADRVDTLAGIFAVGLKPTGNKDPFALRRAALGLARTLIEGELDLDLDALIVEALELLPVTAFGGQEGTAPATRRAALRGELMGFVFERLRGYYAERGFDVAAFEAVLAVRPTNLHDFDRRLRAVLAFAGRPEAASLAAANKRVANLLRKEEESGAAIPAKVDPARLELEAERALAAALEAARSDAAAALRRGDYAAALERLARLQPEVDRFFDEVLVNAEDPTLRANRLALLAQLRREFGAIADIARL